MLTILYNFLLSFILIDCMFMVVSPLSKSMVSVVVFENGMLSCTSVRRLCLEISLSCLTAE